MGDPSGLRPPVLHRWLIRAAGMLVPRKQRDAWLQKQDSVLNSWWVLVERGEIPSGAAKDMFRETWFSFVEAFHVRFEPEQITAFAGRPGLVYSLLLASFLLVALASRGFTELRLLADKLTTVLAYSSLPLSGIADAQNHLIARALPMAFAAIVGAAIFQFRARDMNWYGWRYRVYFASKITGLALILPAAWVELIPLTRKLAFLSDWVAGLTAVISAVAFLAAFGLAVRWAITDQRERCPVCLARLGMPVRFGSWASVFEPATTELVCPDGHGTLCVLETEDAEPEQWSALDSSWRDLFEPAAK